MSLDIKEIKELHDKAYQHGKITRERSADDSVFYWVTQWDESTLGESSLGYKGEFNILRKAGRQIIGDLRANPVQVDFEPKGDSKDGGDLIDGLYRSDDRVNSSIEAYDNAKQETVVAGIGGWELFTEYETNQIGDENQVIRRRPIHEFNNNCFVDPSAKALDKSDADYYSILVPYSHEGMEALIEELTGTYEDLDVTTFRNPEHSYTFPWISGKDEIFYAVRFYHREKVKDTVLRVTDPLGQEMYYLKSATSEIMDELLAEGYKSEETKDIERWKITLYICNGQRIIKEYEVAGQNIPVVPVYGERAFVEGEETYQGVTRLAKDPQRLRNFQMSYLADIVSRSPRPKPIFNPEQIAGFEHMYEETGAENNYPYYLQHRLDANGEPFPIGSVGQMPEQNVPVALMQSIEYSREAVGDVAPANVSQDIADVDLSGKAVAQLQARLDEQSIVYQQNYKHALRRDGEIYASMASIVYDAPRDVTLTNPDGTRTTKQIMETKLDRETGELVVLNDLTGLEFEVFADIGPNYSTKKEQTFEQLGMMIEKAAIIDPSLARMYMLKQSELIDGVDMKDVRDFAHKQLLIAGMIEPDPENEEDMKIMEQAAQQGQEPDANTLLAQAEMEKAKADQMQQQREMAKDQVNAEQNAHKLKIDEYRATTERQTLSINTQVKIEEEKLKHQRETEKLKAENQTRIREKQIDMITQIRCKDEPKEEKEEKKEEKEESQPVIVNVVEAAQPTRKKISITNTPGGMSGEIVTEG